MKVTSDLHVHTSLSLCGDQTADFKDYFPALNQAGIETVGFANHFWDKAVFPADHGFYAPQTLERMLEWKKELDAAEHYGIRVLFGGETEMYYDTSVGITTENTEKLDYLLIPLTHYHITGFSIKDNNLSDEQVKLLSIERATAAANFESKCPVVLAHFPMFFGVFAERQKQIQGVFTKDEIRSLVSLLAERKVALELHSSFACTMDEWIVEFMATAKEHGCKFTFGVDYHSPKSVKEQDYVKLGAFADACGIGEDDLLKI